MVCQSITSGAVLFTNHTSAVKGFLPPNGIPKRFLINGIFSVVRVCFPGPNFPTICPFENKMASWLYRTTSCVAVLKLLCGYFHANMSLLGGCQSTISINAIIMVSPNFVFYRLLNTVNYVFISVYFQLSLPLCRQRAMPLSLKGQL